MSQVVGGCCPSATPEAFSPRNEGQLPGFVTGTGFSSTAGSFGFALVTAAGSVRTNFASADSVLSVKPVTLASFFSKVSDMVLSLAGWKVSAPSARSGAGALPSSDSVNLPSLSFTSALRSLSP